MTVCLCSCPSTLKVTIISVLLRKVGGSSRVLGGLCASTVFIRVWEAFPRRLCWRSARSRCVSPETIGDGFSSESLVGLSCGEWRPAANRGTPDPGVSGQETLSPRPRAAGIGAGWAREACVASCLEGSLLLALLVPKLLHFSASTSPSVKGA